MEIQSNEQWKLDGRCKLCRRQQYCHNECTASKNHQRMVIQRAIREMFLTGVRGVVPPYGSEEII